MNSYMPDMKQAKDWINRKIKYAGTSKPNASEDGINTTSTPITAVGAEREPSTNEKPVDLWDSAYELLRSRDESLVKRYEMILEKEWRSSISSKAVMGSATAVALSIGLGKENSGTTGLGKGGETSSIANSLAKLGTPMRQEQMKALVQSKIEKHKESAWKFKIGSKDVVLRDQTEKFVNTILFAKSFIDFAVSNASEPHVALAWAGVCILLPLIVIPSKQRTAHAKGLTDVADLIQHYSTVEKVYRGKKSSDTINQDFKVQFEAKLMMLYSQILEFQAQSICQLSKNTFMQSFTLPSTWDDLISKIKTSHAACAEKAQLLTDFRLSEVKIAIQDMSKNLAYQFEKMGTEIQVISQYLEHHFEKMEDAQLRRNIYNWLLPPHQRTGEDPLEIHERHCTNHETGTSEWFIDGSYFTDWLRSTKQCLWVYGDVGCGKTILCSSIIEKIREVSLCQEMCRATLDSTIIPRSSIAYFYFTFDTTAAQDPISFLKAIIAQLCLGDRILPQLSELYTRLQEWRAPSFDNLYDTLISVIGGNLTASPALQRYDITQSDQEGPVFLVLDGLDEIPKGRGRLLELLGKLFQLESSRLRMIITSRPQHDIKAALKLSKEWNSYEMPTSEIERDIQSYLKAQIAADERLNSQSHDVQETICERLSKGGVFRLAALQMEALKDYPLHNLTMASLMVILKELPEELEACYQRILEKIPENHLNLRSRFFTALKWITLAQRPMYVEEVAEACMINVDQSRFDTARDIKSRDIVETLSGLIKVTPSPHDDDITHRQSHIVSLAHFSVQEYLVTYENITNENNSSTPYLGKFEPGLAQMFISQSCLIYIYVCSLSLQRHQGMDIWTLKDYAWHHWAAHAQATYSCLLGIHIQPDAHRMFNEVAFPQLYQNASSPEAPESVFSALYREIRRCLSSNKHSSLLAVLQDSTFPEDFISIFRYGSEFQASKNVTEGIETRTIQRPVLTALADDSQADDSQSFEGQSMTYNICEIESKLRRKPLVAGPEMIRLLIIHPSPTKSATIECNLCTDSLHNKPQYIALAYTWGEDSKALGILVNGQSFFVRKNLWLALKAIRDKEQPRVLWVDVVCIDMENYSERNSQVRLMTEVYNGAEQVLVWLGAIEESGEEENDLKSADDGRLRIMAIASPWRRHAQPKLHYLSKALIDKPLRKHEFRGLDAVFERRFWQSSWIVQEVVVAKRVVVRLGNEAIDWDDISDIMQLYDMKVPPHIEEYTAKFIEDGRISCCIGPYPFRYGWAAVETLQYLRKKYQQGQKLTLPELLNLTRHHYSSDGRDKIFAIFTVLQHSERSHALLQPDYSLTIAEVYTRAAEYILEVYENLDILSVCQTKVDSDRYSNGPSWVPAWNIDSGLPLAPGAFAPKQVPLFNAGGSQFNFRTNTHETQRVLTVSGMTVDRLGDFTSIEPDFKMARFLIQHESQPDIPQQQATTKNPERQTMAEVFWRTLLTDRWISPRGEISRLSIDATSGLPEGPMREGWDLENTTKHHLKNESVCMKPFISAMGYALMVPWDARAGDIIVILLGGKVPYVLRKLSMEEEYYDLIGECYVHGLMDGEVFEDEKLQTREFNLV